MKYYFYNKLSNNGLKPELPSDGELVEAFGLDYPSFFKKLKKEDEVVLVGGDGTINYFINAMEGHKISNNVYLYANGSGDDFLRDVGYSKGELVPLNKYLDNLPTVKVNGLEKKFINGIGYGIDGYCCEEADNIKAKTPNKKIDYTAIAIKGLLFFYKPTHAKVTVDGVSHEFDNVWIAATMKGRYYGGGMMVAPQQDRFSDKLSVVVYMGKSKLKTLMVFPKIFEGKHVLHKDMVKVFTGNEIHVEYTKPCAAQIDGDTVLNVSEYWVKL